MRPFGIVVLTMLAAVGMSNMAMAQGETKAGGAAVYKANCVLCHGEDGHAQTTLGKQLKAHDLHSAEVEKKTDAQLKNVITNGQNSMPPFKGQLSPPQISQVLSYVRALGKKK